MRISFHAGTIVAHGVTTEQATTLGLLWDERTREYRTTANDYRDIVLTCKEKNWDLDDKVRTYGQECFLPLAEINPRKHQQEALEAFTEAKGMGVVQLPTGAGKTFLALLAILRVGRPTLILVPTIDLVHQWYEVLTKHIKADIGTVGGGSREFGKITVSTYDSAALFIEQRGDQFGFLIVDECHHLPAPQYRNIALSSVAPFRLGLTATVERADGKEEDIFSLLGEMIYEGRIDELESSVLAPYDIVSIELPMTDDERQRYDERRAVYTSFLRRYNIRFSEPRGWQDFLIKSSRMPGGRDAMKAYRDQKKLAQASRAKISKLWELMGEHCDDRMIVFTDDNDMAYRIGRDFVLPVLTHQTKIAERKQMLQAFRDGEIKVLVTSKVLNEGVDVPEASVGVVVSGSGAVREHVQRLGRILRHRPGKKAIMYELVSQGTSEQSVNRRRKQHYAYQRPSKVPHPAESR